VCAGTLALNPGFRTNDGTHTLRLRAHAWHDVTLELNAWGRRRVARHSRIALWLGFGLDAYAPVVLERVGR
jgi:hypothetical protein